MKKHLGQVLRKAMAMLLCAVLLTAVLPMAVFADESKVVSISVKGFSVPEGTNGYYMYSYNAETNQHDLEWYRYDYDLAILTISFADGTTLTGDWYEIYDKTGNEVSFTDDQDYDNPWGAGKHTVTASYMGVSCDFTVTIEETPVKRFIAEDITLIENCDGYYSYEYNPETDAYDLKWFCYSTDTTIFTVEFKDGTTCTGDLNVIFDKTGYDISFTDDQSYENPWGKGKHTATARFMGVSCDYAATVVENPVKRITATDFSTIEQCGGDWVDVYNPETEQNDLRWFCYKTDQTTLTVEYKDGRKITGESGSIYNETGYDVWFTDDQSYENPWGKGKHDVTATFMGVSCDFTVTVEETPVKSLAAEDITLIEGTYGYHDYAYNPETDAYDLEWFRYVGKSAIFTVEFKDGTTVTGRQYEIYEKTGYEVFVTDDQSYENQWGTGKHTVKASFMGAGCDYTVTIEETPVKRITAEPLTIIEETSGDWYRMIDMETGTEISKYYHYDYDHAIFTVEFKDGTTYTGDQYEIYDKTGQSITATDDQSYDAPWEKGEHTARAILMGVECDISITITQTPVESVTVRRLSPAYEGQAHLLEESFEYTVNYKDGTSFTGTLSQLIQKTGCTPTFECHAKGEAGVGTHTDTVYLMGVSADFSTEIVRMPYTGLSISTGEKMIITLTDADGEQTTLTVKDFKARMADVGVVGGVLETDKGTFSARFYYDQPAPGTSEIKNIALELLNLTSEKMASSAWFEHWYSENMAEDEALAGDVDGDGNVNVSDIIKLKNLIMAGVWTSEELSAGDMNARGKLDVADIISIKNAIMAG